MTSGRREGRQTGVVLNCCSSQTSRLSALSLPNNELYWHCLLNIPVSSPWTRYHKKGHKWLKTERGLVWQPWTHRDCFAALPVLAGGAEITWRHDERAHEVVVGGVWGFKPHCNGETHKMKLGQGISCNSSENVEMHPTHCCHDNYTHAQGASLTCSHLCHVLHLTKVVGDVRGENIGLDQVQHSLVVLGRKEGGVEKCR